MFVEITGKKLVEMVFLPPSYPEKGLMEREENYPYPFCIEHKH